MSASDCFLGTDAGADRYEEAMRAAVDAVRRETAAADRPYTGERPAALAAALPDDVLPASGVGLDAAIDEVAETVLADSVATSHPRCAAHLQCPPMVPALAAEAMLTAANQSMDSFDQAPAATAVEQRVVDACCEALELPADADGVFTSGGTQSNFQALLLARDRFCERERDRDVQSDGLPADAADSLRIVCSEAAHFTTEQSAHFLGLGDDAVVQVQTDDRRRMDVDALERTLERLDADGEPPIAVVATAGTTDFGTVDPLPEVAALADRHGCWFHVDAAYGGALAFSDRHADRLAGVERADSVALDFHKLLFQPISCGALLVADGTEFRLLARDTAYLDPDDAATDAPNLVAKSVQTSRRFDALKPYLTFRALGREELGSLVDSVLDLAEAAGGLLDDADDFELLRAPSLSTVVFRYRPERSAAAEAGTDAETDTGAETSADAETVGEVNDAIRDRLLADGRAIVARTEVDGRPALKLTLLNPTATIEDVAAILDAVRDVGAAVAGQEVAA